MYKRTRDITPYWLFVKDIIYHYQCHRDFAIYLADEIWPTCCEREVYRQEAKRRKEYLKNNGPFYPYPALLLTEETKQKLMELL